MTLTPPILNSGTVLSEMAANRPMRLDKFNISHETRGNKTIINCLGHGGSGFTTLFGSVDQAISLLSINEPIRVLGSGCMGLLAAIELTRRGFSVKGIYTKELYDIASWSAGGYFAFVSIKTSPQEQENLHKIGMTTFRTYQQIERGKHPYLSSDVVRMIPVYCSRDTDSGIEELEARGLISPHENVTLDFGNGIKYPHFLKYRTYYMNVAKIMKQLTHEVKRLQIPIEIREVHSFDEVGESLIFNCTGLGGRVLNNDYSLIPVRGHLLMLDKSAGTAHMDYMIYTKDPNFEGKYIYMFPKTLSVTSTSEYECQGLLGGTFISLSDQDDVAQIDRENYSDLRHRNALFFTGKPFST